MAHKLVNLIFGNIIAILFSLNEFVPPNMPLVAYFLEWKLIQNSAVDVVRALPIFIFFDGTD